MLIATLLLLAAQHAFAGVGYTERPDDFSNGTVYTLQIVTTSGAPATLLISCYPGPKLDVQLAVRNVMFPDDLTNGGMIISTTHKFDKAETAVTSYWFMNMMKYNNSWYRGDKAEFVNRVIKSSFLNIRLDQRNDIFRFNLEGTADHAKKILTKCE